MTGESRKGVGIVVSPMDADVDKTSDETDSSVTV
jgi:hypothetical protein